jgi:hypothetical protein
MPLLILAALVVIVLMLYIALGGKEGAPTINLNKILDFINPKPPAAEAGQDAAADAATETPKATETPETAKNEPATPAPEASAPASATETPETPAPAAPEEGRTETAGDGDAPAAAFASMEELTEFYRKEAERLTGIKH